jgi:hypothetical protein
MGQAVGQTTQAPGAQWHHATVARRRRRPLRIAPCCARHVEGAIESRLRLAGGRCMSHVAVTAPGPAYATCATSQLSRTVSTNR